MILHSALSRLNLPDCSQMLYNYILTFDTIDVSDNLPQF